MNKTFKMLFFLRKNRPDKDNRFPIYCRITVDGQRAEFAIQRTIDERNWNAKSGYPRGNKEEFRELTDFIDTCKAKIKESHRKLIDSNKMVTATSVKNLVQGRDGTRKSIIEVFEYHNQQLRDLIGKGIEAATVTRYESTFKHIKAFIRTQFLTDNLYLNQVDHEFITLFEHYLKTARSCSNNTTMKYIANFKKIILIAFNNNWIEKNPFSNYKIKLVKTQRAHLTQEELELLEKKEFPNPRLGEIRDAFVFSCYTGLPFSDMKTLSYDQITKGIDGNDWINGKRTKTKIPYKVRLVSQALSLIDKYKTHPLCVINGLCFPMKSNQKTNEYLKEIGRIAGIKKELTYHMARHTFATSITLNNGVPMEDVSYMMGHTSIKTTEIYSKVSEKRVGKTMQSLEDTLNKPDISKSA